MVLGIDTATDVCAVGLVDGERDLADLALLKPRGHGARLAGLIQAALDAAGASPQDLRAVAVSSGPGSYTGLRIGASTAKGLCLATGAALVSVPTLAALAEGASEQTGGAAILTVLPSRRGEVYAATFRAMEGGGMETLREATPLALDDVAAWVPPSDEIAVVGPATEAVLPLLGPEAFAPGGRVSGLTVARIGRQRAAAGETEDVAAFEPAYLKPFVSGGV